MNWNKLRNEVHRVAVEHGWWEKPVTFSEIIAMCHSELSEAMEEYRAGRPMVYCDFHDSCEMIKNEVSHVEAECAGLNCLLHFPNRKPEGIAVELGDCILRILDYMGQVGGDVDGVLRRLWVTAQNFSSCEAKPLPDLVAGCHYLLSCAYESQRQAELAGRKKNGKVKPARKFHPFRVRDYERTARTEMVICILDIVRWAKANGLDMEKIITAKHEYNQTRSYRHGGKRL